MDKEISDALHFLLHCSLKDIEFETQREQFEFIYKYIENLEKETEKLHHYKTLYQSLKKQKEELRDWLEEMLDNKYDIFSVVRVKDVLSKLEELEMVTDE